jgi:hypothetical protein
VRGSQHGPSEREEGLGLAHGPCPTSLSDPVEILKDESTAAKARIAALIDVLPILQMVRLHWYGGVTVLLPGQVIGK